MDDLRQRQLLPGRRCDQHVLERPCVGSKLGRVEIPHASGETTTQFFAGSSLYRLTPVSEEVARSVAAKSADTVPIKPWEMPRQLPAPRIADTEEHSGNCGLEERDADDDPDEIGLQVLQATSEKRAELHPIA